MTLRPLKYLSKLLYKYEFYFEIKSVSLNIKQYILLVNHYLIVYIFTSIDWTCCGDLVQPLLRVITGLL
mgnify:CR=1 FL=1